MNNIILSFGIIIIAGVIFRQLRIGEIDADTMRVAINVSVINIFLPALCIKTIYTSEFDRETFLIPIAAWITTISTLLITIFIYSLLERWARLSSQTKGVLIISATFGNVTYLGLPVITGLFGSEAAKYALFYDLLATTPILWLIGAPLASKYGRGKGIKLRESIRGILNLPPIWGIIFGFSLKFMDIQLPFFVLKTLEMLGNSVIPLMVFSIGLALTIPKVQGIYAILPAIFIKFFISPFIAYLSAYSLGIRGNALASCTIEGAMPTMILSILIASRFGLDVSLSAFIIVITTILSFVILPVIIYMTNLLIH